MKKLAATILVGSFLASSSVLAQVKKGNAAPATAITQEKAQALAMQKYPGAHVLSTKMDTMKGNSVWVVTFTRTGGNLSEKVAVDAQTGKVSKM